MQKIKKILWFTWKDQNHPLAGGAELVNEQIASRLVKQGIDVTFLVSGYKGCKHIEIKNGYKIIRLGSAYSVYWKALIYYRKNLKDWPDFVIDEVNTVPFFCHLYIRQPSCLFFQQIAGRVWFYQAKFPLNLFGYVLEKLYLKTFRNRPTMCISESVKKDLENLGLRRVKVINQGMVLKPISRLQTINKFKRPTILSLGEVRPMKRVDQIIKAYVIAKDVVDNLDLIVAGSPRGKYGKKIKAECKKNNIQFLGRVSEKKKIELMSKSHLFCMTSAREGWGLTITESASQGTPAIGYRVSGIESSIKDRSTGYLTTKNNPNNLALLMVKLLTDKNEYQRIQKNAWEFSKTINFENATEDFIKTVNGFLKKAK